MSTGMKFGITAAVVIGVVALGYWMHKRQQEKAAAAAPKTGAKGDFAKNKDGSPDYTRKADGTKIQLT